MKKITIFFYLLLMIVTVPSIAQNVNSYYKKVNTDLIHDVERTERKNGFSVSNKIVNKPHNVIHSVPYSIRNNRQITAQIHFGRLGGSSDNLKFQHAKELNINGAEIHQSNKTSAYVCDTFSNVSVNDTAVIYTLPGYGYISGNNSWKDKAVADYFSDYMVSGSQLTDVYIAFGQAQYSSLNSTVRVVVWDNTGTNGEPGNVLGYEKIKITDIQSDIINGDVTQVNFSSPITLNSPYYVGVVFKYGNGDTVAVYSNTVYNSGANTSWTLWSTNEWYEFSDTSNWGLSLSHYIFPVVCGNIPSLITDFSANTVVVNVGEYVAYSDLTTGSPTNWDWEFEGGLPATSSLQNPTAFYYNPGTYKVKLTTNNGYYTDIEEKIAYIQVNSSLNSCDTLSNYDFFNDTAVSYTYSGGYISGNNDFGDLAKADYFSVYPLGKDLTSVYFGFAKASYNNSSSYVTINVWDNTGPSGEPGTILASENVLIKDIADDINNGLFTEVIFSNSVSLNGPYYVGLELSNSYGDTVALYTNTFYTGSPNTAWEQWSDNSWYAYEESWGVTLSHLIFPVFCGGDIPDADFKADLTSVNVGQTVNFTDLSANTPTSWSWLFLGANTLSSTDQNPNGVTYSVSGTYSVSLIATNAFGADTAIKVDYITVIDTQTTTINLPEANFKANYTYISEGTSIDFTDLTTNNPTSWQWSFSGASTSTSTVQNPIGIEYLVSGSYDVTLIAVNTDGSDTVTKTAYITVVPLSITCDTITNVDVNHTPVLQSLSGGGYVSGHNYYGDIAKAEYFANYTPGAELTAAYLWFGTAQYSSSTSKVTVNVWDNTGTNGEPGTILTSEDILISDIADDINNGEITLVQFATPAIINTPFYVGVELYYQAGDTVALVHNYPGETVPATAWEQWYDYSWYSYGDTMSWGWDVAHYIFASLCSSNPITEIDMVSNINDDVVVFPNPSEGEINIYIGAAIQENLNVSIYNSIGELVYRQVTIENNIKVNLGNTHSGIYFVEINNSGKIKTKRVVVQ